jgi:hypothetical protein
MLWVCRGVAIESVSVHLLARSKDSYNNSCYSYSNSFGQHDVKREASTQDRLTRLRKRYTAAVSLTLIVLAAGVLQQQYQLLFGAAAALL